MVLQNITLISFPIKGRALLSPSLDALRNEITDNAQHLDGGAAAVATMDSESGIDCMPPGFRLTQYVMF